MSSALSALAGRGNLGTAGLVRMKRGAGWVTLSSSMNVPRATLCGCVGASRIDRTGAKQVSVASSKAHHSSRVLPRKRSARIIFISGHFALSHCFGTNSGSMPRRCNSFAWNLRPPVSEQHHGHRARTNLRQFDNFQSG